MTQLFINIYDKHLWKCNDNQQAKRRQVMQNRV